MLPTKPWLALTAVLCLVLGLQVKTWPWNLIFSASIYLPYCTLSKSTVTFKSADNLLTTLWCCKCDSKAQRSVGLVE